MTRLTPYKDVTRANAQEDVNQRMTAYVRSFPPGRRKPYTDRGLCRVPCVKCGRPSVAQWHVCADGKWYGVCNEHDLELNRIGLEWAFGPDRAAELMRGYE